MDFKEYIKGQGIDVSQSLILDVKNCKHIFVEPDNLYTLKSLLILKV